MDTKILIAILIVIPALIAFVVYKIKNPSVDCAALPPATRKHCK